MFWAESGLSPKVMMARLDGSDQQILASQGLVRPLGLTVNYDEGELGTLYWCDQVRGEKCLFKKVIV